MWLWCDHFFHDMLLVTGFQQQNFKTETKLVDEKWKISRPARKKNEELVICENFVVQKTSGFVVSKLVLFFRNKLKECAKTKLKVYNIKIATRIVSNLWEI